MAVIGCGAIARRAYIPLLTSLSNSELIAIVDVDETLAKRVAKTHKIPRFFKDYKDVLRDESIDLVCICTPPDSHASMALDALRAGKHVLIEKPLALSVKDGKKIIEMAKKVNRKLCVVHEYRYFPSMRKVRERVQSGALGTITSIMGVAHTHIPLTWTKSTWLYREEIGVLYDFTPHLIDAILWINESNIDKVVAFGHKFPIDIPCLTEVEIMIKFKNGVVALADASWLTGTTMFTLSIYGTGGRIFEDVFYDHFIEAHGILTPFSELRSSFNKTLKSVKRALSGSLFKGGIALYKEFLSDLINSIEKNSEVPVPGEEALNVLAVCEAAKLSIEQRRIVDIEEIMGE